MQTIELRWLTKSELVGATYHFTNTLQQRTRSLRFNAASGAFCGLTDWSEWTDVPTVTHDATNEAESLMP